MVRRIVSIALATIVVVIGAGGEVGTASAVNATLSSETLPWSTPGPVRASFSAASCSGRVCVAVGQEADASVSSSAPTYPVLEVWSSGTWSAASTRALGANIGALQFVSCGTPTSCVVIASTSFTMAERDAKWTVSALPALPRVTGPYPPNLPDIVTGLSCVGTSCVAVGLSDEGLYNSDVPVVWTLADATWSVVETPVPSGTAAALASVSCVDALDCTAIGTSYSITDLNGYEGYVAEETDGSWTSAESVVPTGVTPNAAMSISCWTASSCDAATTIEARAAGRPEWRGVVFAVSGTTLSPTVLPPPPGDNYTVLNSLVCTSATWCVAVGWSALDTSAGSLTGERSLSVTWAGTSWGESLVTSAVELTAVACWASSQCLSVGAYDNATTDYAATLSSSTWTTDSPVISGPPAAQLNAISCPTSLFCAAVGQFTNAVSLTQPLIEMWNGSTWRPSTGLVPSGATSGTLSAVSCTTAESCVAVGVDSSSSGVPGVFADVLHDQAWGDVPVPTLPGWIVRSTSSTWPSFSVTAISCATTENCVAVGNRTRTNGQSSGFIETLQNNTWHASAPGPTGVTASSLAAVSCWAASQCAAVGVSVKSGVQRAELLTLDAGVLRTEVPRLPGVTSANLTGVSCTSRLDCHYVGVARVSSSSPERVFFIDSGPVGGPWREINPSQPVNARVRDSVAIDCIHATCLSVVGNPTPVVWALVDGTWGLVDSGISTPANVTAASVSAVSCAPTGWCVAVGSGDVSAAYQSTFVKTLVPLVLTVS